MPSHIMVKKQTLVSMFLSKTHISQVGLWSKGGLTLLQYSFTQ